MCLLPYISYKLCSNELFRGRYKGHVQTVPLAHVQTVLLADRLPIGYQMS